MAGTIKISQISKDFNISSKDVLTLFASELGIEKKSGGTAETEEFELFMQRITKAHQIKNIDAYLSGENKISRTDTDTKKAAAAKPEVKAEAKPEVKAEAKPEVKTEAKPTVKAEAKPAAEVHKAAADKTSERPAQDRTSQPRTDGNRPSSDRGYRDGHDKDRRGGEYPRRDGKDRQGQSGRSDSRYSGASFDPFAKKRENMNRQAEGYKRPMGANQDTRRPDMRDKKPEGQVAAAVTEKPKAPVQNQQTAPVQQKARTAYRA